MTEHEALVEISQPQGPTTIDVNPTAACNLRCEFCWGPDHLIPDMLSTSQWCDVLTMFRQLGATSVVFTGGEPLIRRDISVLFAHAYEVGLRVTLSTNGLLLARNLQIIGNAVHEIGLPIDGPDRDTHAAMRAGRLGAKSFDRVLAVLPQIRDKFPGIEVTIRTVVSAKNSVELPALADLLESLAHMWDRWKLYEFTPASYGAEAASSFALPEGEFDMSVNEARERLDPSRRVGVQRAADRDGRYLFVGPTGDLFVASSSTPDGYDTIGDVNQLHTEAGQERILTRLGRNNADHGVLVKADA